MREYLGRLEATTTAAAARTQALAEPGARFDFKRGVVLDANGDPVAGTESPFRTEVRGTSTSRPPRSNATATPTPADTGARVVVPINNDADFNKLPSGTRFVGPDGKTRVKP